MDGTNALTESLEAARRQLAAALREDLRPLADRLVAGPAAEADAPADARDCLGHVAKATANLGRVIDELIPPAADDRDAEAFLAQIRHNLKTPIHQVVGYAELLMEEAGPWNDRHAADLERLRILGQQLRAVIDGLLQPANEPDPTPTGPAAPVAPAAADQRGRILVVDDQASNRDLLARWLGRLGHEYATAENGASALAILAREEFDLVLLDYLMPELDGKEVLKRLKADPKLRHLPVIMISALNELDNVVGCIEIGAEDYLPKPFQPVLLKARLGACLEKKRLRDREVDHLRQIDELLNAILPPQIVRELTATGQVQPRRHERVAVLFADIVGFTGYCEKRKPEEVVEHLRGLVETFEETAVKHGVQKIKTIGDSFMAAAGLLEELANPVLPCVRCAREMIALCKDLPPHWDLRVGIHAGSVVAGLLGSRQYLYDLWGATVNTAARVEALGMPGSVCLSKAAWEYVAASAEGESRGFMEAKGIGRMEVMRFTRFRGEP